jgi:hypothetical protein
MTATPIHGGTGIQWQDDRIMFLIRHDERIWDMGMRLADIPLVTITTDATGEFITDGPLPTPTDDFVRMAGFEYVRRGGTVTADIDASSIARATLAKRTWPLEHLLRLRSEIDEAPVEDNEPTGNGPIHAHEREGDAIGASLT